jgi:disulfide bond formation protein DsbB
MYFLLTLNLLLASGGLLLLLVTISLFVDYYRYRSIVYRRFIAPYAWWLIMATTIFSVALSLVYSEYFGFIPCSLCWLQRIALYPQAILSVIAYKTKDTLFYPLYGIALSIFGILVATYHYIYQMVPKELLTSGAIPCLADGSADCASKVIDLFGFVTFPLLSAITFLFLIVMYLNQRRVSKAQD